MIKNKFMEIYSSVNLSKNYNYGSQTNFTSKHS